MAASYIYGLAASDIAAEIPGVDDSNIGASTEPVSTTDLTNWINDGAGRLNAVLDKSGITAGASMDADTHQMCTIAVKAYAIQKALLVMGETGPAYEAAREEWAAIYTEISNRPQQLGDAYDDGLTVAVDSLSTYSSTSRRSVIDDDVPVDEWMG